MALWTSRALKYLKYHRTGRTNERFGGCAAKKSPFLPKRAEQAKKAKKRPKSVSSQWTTTVKVVILAALLKSSRFLLGRPKVDPGWPPGPCFALVACVGTPQRSVPTRSAKTLWCAIEMEPYIQIHAKLLQRTLGGGGNRGLL